MTKFQIPSNPFSNSCCSHTHSLHLQRILPLSSFPGAENARAGHSLPGEIPRGVFSLMFSQKMGVSSSISGCHSRTWQVWVTKLSSSSSITSAASAPCSTLQRNTQCLPSHCKFHNNGIFAAESNQSCCYFPHHHYTSTKLSLETA